VWNGGGDDREGKNEKDVGEGLEAQPPSASFNAQWEVVGGIGREEGCKELYRKSGPKEGKKKETSNRGLERGTSI